VIQEGQLSTEDKASQESNHSIAICNCVKNPGGGMKTQLGHKRAEAAQLHGAITQ